MSIDRCHVGGAGVLVVTIALSGSVIAQSAGQAPRQPAGKEVVTDSAAKGQRVDPVTGAPMAAGAGNPGAASAAAKAGGPADPAGVARQADATGGAPGSAAGEQSPVKASGK